MKDRTGLRSVCVDCHHPAALAKFWAAALGWTVRPHRDEDLVWLAERGLAPDEDPNVCVDPPDRSLPTLWFNEVSEPKVGKVRIHLDANVDATSGIDDLVAMGARVIEANPGGEQWTVMADPEGHEFCAFPFGGR